MSDRAKYIQLAVQNGITDLSQIRDTYNSYAEEGRINRYDDGGLSNKLGKVVRGLWDTMKSNKPSTSAKSTEIVTGSTHKSRVRENTSPTAHGKWDTGDNSFSNSTELEDYINSKIPDYYREDPKYFLPFIEDQEIRVRGNRMSKNQLDSLAKYAGQAGVPKEAIGLGFESIFGSVPLVNVSSALKLIKGNDDTERDKEKDKIRDRVISNANYNRAFGGVPASAFIRDAEYTERGYNRGNPYEGHPLVHGFDYFDRGLYNPGYAGHRQQVYNIGKDIFKDKNIQDWWNTSGKKFYTMPRTEESKKALKSYEGKYPEKYKRKHSVNTNSNGGKLNKF